MGLVPPDRLAHGVRRGAVAALATLGLVFAGLVVAMALSLQARTTRSTFAALTMGRYAVEIAESGVEETLAEVNDLLAEAVEGQDLRAALRERGEGGKLAGEEVLGVEALTHPPARTRALLEEAAAALELSEVRVRPLYYDTLTNHGALELSCVARRLPGGSGPPVTRRVIARFFFTVDGFRNRFRVDPLPFQRSLDRRPLP